jgi:hypothetical protein
MNRTKRNKKMLKYPLIIATFLGCSALTTSCKTTNPRANASTSSVASANARSSAIRDFDIATLQSHFASAAELLPVDFRSIWAIMLLEGDATAACPGQLSEHYYFYATGPDEQVTGYMLAQGTPMPMNGPCGLAWDITGKTFREVSAALIDSAPLSAIESLKHVRISPAEAVKLAETKHPTFKYRDGIKIFHHPHPDLKSNPWYKIYGVSCGADSSVMLNAQTGATVDTIDSPTSPCPN